MHANNNQIVDLLRPLWRDATAGVRIAILQKAHELGLWSLLLKPKNSNDVSAATGLSIKEAELFLNTLWSMQILQRLNNHENLTVYNLNPDYAPLFDEMNKDYFVDALFNRLAVLRNYALSIQTMGNACNDTNQSIPQTWDAAGKKHLYQDQQVLIAPCALAMVAKLYSKLPAGEKSHFLDLGGNPGNVALALLKQYPQFTGHIIDLPETQEVISKNIHQHSMENRLEVIVGTFPQEPLPSESYDFIWCSQLFYFLPDITAGLSAIYDGLKAGGLVFFVHAEIPNNPLVASAVLPWYSNMILKEMPILNEGQWAEKLAAIGFQILADDYAESFPVCPLKLLIAQK